MSRITLNSVFFSSCGMSEKLHLLSILSRMNATSDFDIVKFLLDGFKLEQAEELCIHLIKNYELPYEKKQSKTVVEDSALEVKTAKGASQKSVVLSKTKGKSKKTSEQNLTSTLKTEHKRGRPKGSKNKPKNEALSKQDKQEENVLSPKVADESSDVGQSAEEVEHKTVETMTVDELIARDKIGDKLNYSLLYSYAIGVNKSRLIRSNYRLSFASCIGIFVPYLKSFAQQVKCEEFILDVEEGRVTPGTTYQKVCSLASNYRPKYQGNVWSALTEAQMASIKPVVDEINSILRKVGGDAFHFHYNVGKYACPSVKDKHRYSCNVF